MPNQPLHLRPAQSASLASSLERSIPVPLRYALECVDSIAVVGHRVVGRMPSDYARQPLPLFWDRKVSSLKKLLLHLTEFGSLPLSSRSTLERKPTPSVSPTDVIESQKDVYKRQVT